MASTPEELQTPTLPGEEPSAPVVPVPVPDGEPEGPADPAPGEEDLPEVDPASTDPLDGKLQQGIDHINQVVSRMRDIEATQQQLAQEHAQLNEERLVTLGRVQMVQELKAEMDTGATSSASPPFEA